MFLCGDSMNFSTYQREFIAEARKHDKNDEYIEKCLAYAKNLVDKRLPIIYDEKHFSQLVGIDLDYLLSAANSPKHFYRYFTIPKRNGKIRKISEPLPVLKEAQYYILNNILKKVPCSIYAKAYKPGATLKGNAKFHRKQPVLVKLDLKDYFPSLHESRVSTFSSVIWIWEICQYSNVKTMHFRWRITTRSTHQPLSFKSANFRNGR